MCVCLSSSVFLDPEELCEKECSSLSACQSSGTESHEAVLQRALAAEERARLSEEALARAMDDLHKLKSVTFCVFTSFVTSSNYMILQFVYFL